MRVLFKIPAYVRRLKPYILRIRYYRTIFNAMDVAKKALEEWIAEIPDLLFGAGNRVRLPTIFLEQISANTRGLHCTCFTTNWRSVYLLNCPSSEHSTLGFHLRLSFHTQLFKKQRTQSNSPFAYLFVSLYPMDPPKIRAMEIQAARTEPQPHDSGLQASTSDSPRSPAVHPATQDPIFKIFSNKEPWYNSQTVDWLLLMGLHIVAHGGELAIGFKSPASVFILVIVVLFADAHCFSERSVNQFIHFLFLFNFVSSPTGTGLVQKTVTAPLDRVKILMQVQGLAASGASARPLGTFECARGVAQREGMAVRTP